jgi:NADPH:quinone reductase-like Zn-dependent oxidoreductase
VLGVRSHTHLLPNIAALAELVAMAASGELRVVVERTYSLADAQAAHMRSESRRTRGKLVFSIAQTLASDAS